MTDIAELTCKYVQFLSEEGVEGITSYRAFLLKTRLLRHFGEALMFHRPHKPNVDEFVFSSNVSPGPLVEKCVQALAALESASLKTHEPGYVSQAPTKESPVSTPHKAALLLR